MSNNAQYLKLARETVKKQRENGTLVVCHNPAQKLANARETTGRVTMLQAIKATCWGCMGGTATEWDPDIKRMIRECTSGPDSAAPCPLHDFRPYSGAARRKAQ